MKQGILRAFYTTTAVVFLCLSALAQTAAYTVHTIVAGESLSSLAREYHTTVGDIMRLNDMNTDSKLSLGMKLKIPATSEPVQRETPAPPKATPAAPATSSEARTHTVQTGESLYRISKMYGLSVEKLMALNSIGDGGSIKVGQVLLVSDGTAPPQPAKAAAADPTPPAPKPAQEVKQTAAPSTTAAPANTSADYSQAPREKKESQPVAPAPAPATQPVFASNAAAPKEGFFTTQFRQNTEGRGEQIKTGAAMTFKSASGWADKKYYILMNDAPPGSIVKVRNGNNVIYAKVLWSLGTQKENEGLEFRISTASAAALNITDEKFEVAVTYFQ